MWQSKNYKGKISSNVELGARTWFRAGGRAAFLFEPHDEADLQLFLQSYPQDAPLYVLGAGSNTLVRDGGVEGVVLVLPFKNIEVAGETISAGAGALAQQLSQTALDGSLTGFEFMRGIPGSVGGCLAMNAGAYDSDTAAVFVKALAYTRQGEKQALSKEQMQFGYRTALNNYIFTEGIFNGRKADKKDIKQKMADAIASRKEAQPAGARTSGSTFKNPPQDITQKKAWQLIDEAGCRNFSVGDAHVNDKHCNFLVNSDRASATDIETLGEKIRAKVYDKTKVKLEWEIKRIGESK